MAHAMTSHCFSIINRNKRRCSCGAFEHFCIFFPGPVSCKRAFPKYIYGKLSLVVDGAGIDYLSIPPSSFCPVNSLSWAKLSFTFNCFLAFTFYYILNCVFFLFLFLFLFFFSLSFKIKKLIIFVVGLVIFFFPDFRSNWLAVGFFFFFFSFV